MRRISMMAAATIAALAGSGAMAQMAEKSCAATPAAPPAELAGWSSPVSIAAAGDASATRGATLDIGKAATATLKPTDGVAYSVPPEKPGGSASYGGLFAFAVTEAGTYRIALGAGAWIDVVGNGKPVTSSTHGHGPDCSGIRKMVDFPLVPGRYLLQIAASGAPALTLMVARLP